MKKFLFLIVIFAICAAAYIKRPANPKEDFTSFWVQKKSAGDSNGLVQKLDEVSARRFADQCQYLDRYLWIDVRHDDTTVYTSAFGHWFNRAEVKQEIQQKVGEAKEKAKEQMGQAQEKAKEQGLLK